MFYFKKEDTYYASTSMPKNMDGMIKLTQAEYQEAMEAIEIEKQKEERAEKEALLRQLMAELYPGDDND